MKGGWHMETNEIINENSVTLSISGEIDGTNVDEFDTCLNQSADKTESLILDLEGLEYVSSAGLRVFLNMQKKMKQRGHEMVLHNVNDEVMDIFRVTGFVKLLNIV